MTSPTATSIPRPPRRVFTRLVVPGVILAGAIAAVLWSGWHTFAPATPVRVVQVVLKSADALGGGTEPDTATSVPSHAAPDAVPNTPPARTSRLTGPSVQAPGWVEPAPFPVMVPALTPGTVKDVLVLEGDTVRAGQVLAQLYDEEQAIALQLAQAMLDGEAARLAEMNDELRRKETLISSGAVAAADVARLRLRIAAMGAAVRAATAERDMRALVLERTQVRAPRDGVVMARLAAPGMAAGSMADGTALLELYDPASLQVRADVPLADAGLIAIGQPAEIQVDVLPNRVFRGTVARLLHQADIAKNTVQAKVVILEPAPELKPEMLARVRIFAARHDGTSGGSTAGGSAARGTANGAAHRATNDSAASERHAGAGLRQSVWAPEAGLRRSAAGTTALAVRDLRDGVGFVELREVRLTGAEIDGWYEVSAGVRPGDLLVATDSPPVQPGARVRIEHTTHAASNTALPQNAQAARTGKGATDGDH